MSEFNEAWIAALWSADEKERADAAARVFAAGCSLAEQAVHGWWKNQEFRQLFDRELEVTVGLAVRPGTFARIREATGWPRLAEVPAEQDATEFELHFNGRVALDILTSREPEGSGTIAKFLLKHGEGVQQVEFRCSDVDRAAAILREQFGVQSVYPQKRPGADGAQVNFFLALSAHGKKVLIELYEPPAIRL
jgi:hypothetical protein